MSHPKEAEMGGDGNNEQSENLNQPQEDREGAISRRDFLKVGMVAGGGLALRALFGGLFRKPVTAETRNALDTAAVFSLLKKEKTDLEAKPDIVYSPFLVKDASGNVTAIYTIAEAHNPNGSSAGRRLYKSSLEGDEFSRFQAFPKFSIAPSSVVVAGSSVLLGGDAQTQNLALQFAPDGHTFKPVTNLPNNDGFVIESKMLPNTNKTLLTWGNISSPISTALFDFDTQEVQTILADGGWAPLRGLAVTT